MGAEAQLKEMGDQVPPLPAGAFCGHVGTGTDWEGQSRAKGLWLALTSLIPGPLELQEAKAHNPPSHALSQ